MRIFFTLMVCALCIPKVFAFDDFESFDVPGGRFRTIPFEVEDSGGLDCIFDVEKYRYKGKWGPTLSILAAESPFSIDSPLPDLVKISVSKTREDDGLISGITVSQKGDTVYEYDFSGFIKASNTIFINLKWGRDGEFDYETLNEYSFGRGKTVVPNFITKEVFVALSGVKGKFSCEVHRPDDAKLTK